MTVIEHRVEAAGQQYDYSGHTFTAEEIEAGEHRAFIGGVWETHGERQRDFLISQGLLPSHRMLDVGCGCFRAGRHFIDYLDPAHYYGVDANHAVMQAGYDVELTDAQREKLPIANLRANDRFDGDFGVPIDYALAQSVFTHVSLNHIRLCLHRLAGVIRPGGSFYATFFEQRPRTSVDFVLPSRSGRPFHTEKDPFWYYRSDLAWAARSGPWKFNYIGDWGHPAKQMMAQFVRLTDDEVVARDRRRAARKRRAGRPTPEPHSALVPEIKKAVRKGRKWAARKLDPGSGKRAAR